MNSSPQAVITGSGSFIPTRIIPNSHFLHHTFYDIEGQRLEKSNEEIIHRFREITGIEERRYVADNLVASDCGYHAAEQALISSSTDKETLDYIILAHNFGDVLADNRRTDCVPSLASRVKQKLDIRNPKTVAYDLPFGCAGWLQGVIQANYYIRSGEAKKVLVIGAETLSRIADPHDRDSMIYSDGAGAVILEAQMSAHPAGVLSHHSETFSGPAFTIYMAQSNNKSYPENHLFLKMHGHKLYEYALKLVPAIIKTSLEKAGLTLSQVNKLLIHQANQKMDVAILDRLASLCGNHQKTEGMMPMTISWLGNSSVATVPTLYDLLVKGQLKNHSIAPGHIIAFAAVGAGININAMIYKVPEK